MDVTVDKVKSSTEVLVVSDERMPSSVIIGQNFTELSCITVVKDSNGLSLYKSPTNDPSETSIGIIKVNISKDTNISKIAAVPVHSGGSTHERGTFV